MTFLAYIDKVIQQQQKKETKYFTFTSPDDTKNFKH